MNHKFFTLYRFSLFQKLRAKSFLISTVLMIIFLVGFSNIERIIDWFSGDDPKIAVVSTLDTNILPVLKEVGIKTAITEKDYTLKQSRQVVDKGTYDAVALLSDDPYRVTLISASPEQELQTQLSTALKQVRDQKIITEADVDPALLASLAAPIDVKQELTSTGGKSEDELFAASALVYVLLFLMYFTIAIYGGMIVTEIANEKSSRVMELLISASNICSRKSRQSQPSVSFSCRYSSESVTTVHKAAACLTSYRLIHSASRRLFTCSSFSYLVICSMRRYSLHSVHWSVGSRMLNR